MTPSVLAVRGVPIVGCRRVLIVDWHEPSRIAISIALSMRGHVCNHVASEPDAVGAIVLFRPSAIVVDRGRATQVGICGRLRTVAKAFVSDLIVIATSALAESPSIRDSDPVDAYLTKPIEITALDQLLRRAMDSTQQSER